MAASITRAWKHLPFSGSSRCLVVKGRHPPSWNGRVPGCQALASTVGTQGLSNHSLQRFYSATPPPQRPPTFLGKIIENLREEMSRNQKMKESLKEFRKDMEKLEKSEALQKAREKYQSVEEETAEGSKKAKQQLEFLKKRVSETVEEAQKAEILQKASKMTEEATRQAQKVSQTISQKGEELSKTQTFKTISETAKAVKEEIDHSTFGGAGARVYRAPRELRKRVERDPEAEQRIIQANTEASGMVLHKDSQFAQSWQNFKDNNPYVNRVLVWKTKLDESDNPVVRASMLVKDKVSELFGGVFQRTELSEALTEICKMDPTFDKERFLLECEYDMIPNVLEAMIRPDLEILKDWCYERAFSVLATPVKQAYQLGFKFDSKVLDVDNVDLVMGKVMDEGPVLAISFQSQQIMCLRNQKGEVVEGDPSKVLRVQYVWVLCRDQTELDSRAAWRILDLSAQSTEQFV
ncbi:mitochondrial import inner membrane translocase subunit TIM44 [Penaeus vannamei]|uniref:Mitochondrial import inner membrane translocase subunit TIM44 n=2 Tax=Penaeus vannamei TaxID=6689 RepID=A0A3R7P064_PENVA|nr:mitochondrial import inner membrane translocase subunit TIM44-like isoform X2 [Penaeus vannamei]ROT71656.1 Mitochondrial import inner membrane translocase subunit TIM44 [Penaeus vannamei]